MSLTLSFSALKSDELSTFKSKSLASPSICALALSNKSASIFEALIKASSLLSSFNSKVTLSAVIFNLFRALPSFICFIKVHSTVKNALELSEVTKVKSVNFRLFSEKTSASSF